MNCNGLDVLHNLFEVFNLNVLNEFHCVPQCNLHESLPIIVMKNTKNYLHTFIHNMYYNTILVMY